jgi:Sulfotransferase domain
LASNDESRSQSIGRLPDFIAVGPARTGTTWLHGVLFQRASLPRGTKETRYFDSFYDKGIGWYRDYFTDCPADRPVGEVAPTYFQKPEVRERIARDVPNCRIICSLRDPVERAYSTYRVFVREGETRLGFEEEVMLPNSRIREANRYAFHLRGWQETFGAANVATFFYDDLEHDEQAYVDSICDFLAVPRVDLSEVRQFLVRNSVRRAPRSVRVAGWAHNFRIWLKSRRADRVVNTFDRWGIWRLLNQGKREFPPLDPQTEARMRKLFLPEVEALEELVGRDLTAWKTGHRHSAAHASAGHPATLQRDGLSA